MEDEMLKMCKRVAYYGEIPDAYCHKIIEIGCNNCPFASVDCGKNYKTVQEIAQKYIKEHEKTVNTIEKIEEKPKYKVGDKVRVKSLDPDKYHESLIEYVGEILTIKKAFNNNFYYVNENVFNNSFYYVNENYYVWDEDMLEPVEEVEEKITLKELQ